MVEGEKGWEGGGWNVRPQKGSGKPVSRRILELVVLVVGL